MPTATAATSKATFWTTDFLIIGRRSGGSAPANPAPLQPLCGAGGNGKVPVSSAPPAASHLLQPRSRARPPSPPRLLPNAGRQSPVRTGNCVRGLSLSSTPMHRLRLGVSQRCDRPSMWPRSAASAYDLRRAVNAPPCRGTASERSVSRTGLIQFVTPWNGSDPRPGWSLLRQSALDQMWWAARPGETLNPGLTSTQSRGAGNA